MVKPTLSIIVLSYNTKKLLAQCWQSLLKNDRRLDFSGSPLSSDGGEKIPTEIIVVDNHSTDGSQEYLRNLQLSNPNFQFKVIFNKKNLGFAGGNNVGIKAARGEFILLLNSDTIVPEAAISQTLLWLTNHPQVGVVSCRLINPDRTTQPTGGFFPNIFNLFCWATFLDDLPLTNRLIKPFHPHSENFYLKESWYQKTRPLDWVTGAFLLTRKAVIREVGGLNEDFFMYVEELEWCYRIRKKGWQVYFYHGAKIVHLGGGSGTSLTSILGEDKGLIKFFLLHRPRWQLPLVKIILKLKNATRFLLFGIIKKDEEKKIAFQKALREL